MRKEALKLILVFLILSGATECTRAQYAIDVRVKGMQTTKAFLLEFLGTNPVNLIDSAQVTEGDRIHFSLPENAHPGMYRLVMGRQTWLDFIFNSEDIDLVTDFSAPVDSLQVIQSKENELWREYMNYHVVLNRKQEYLYRLQELYHPGDEFFHAIQKEIAGLQQTDPEEVARQIIDRAPESYVARFLQVELSPDIPVGLSMDEEMDYVLEHFLDDVNFDDPDLRYSPPLMSRINTYFGLFQQAYPPAELEERMIDGLNRVLSLAAVNDTVYDFVLDQLTRQFEHAEFETLFAYLTENFLLDGSCKDEAKSKELEEILSDIKKTEIGRSAPALVIPQQNGEIVLSEMKNPFTLILFWASWCPHCTEVLPQIKSIYQQYHPKGFEIIAISLDTDQKAYEKAVQSGGYNWINYSEFKGWDSSIAEEYGIRATPTMILVNQQGEIVAKPARAEILESLLSNLL